MARPKSAFALMSEPELLEYCRNLISEHGFAILTFKSLKARRLYFPLYSRGLTQKRLLEKLGLEEDYAAHSAAQPRQYAGVMQERWSWERVVRVAKETKEEHGHLPPAGWFQRNKLGSLVFYVYESGHTWDELETEVTGSSGGNFVESRNGMRWLSHAEASLSNFLYARGVQHRKGERYPDGFAEVGDAKYAIYDLHFSAVDGRTIDVEVWGDNPDGHGRDTYARRRGHKEAFNRDNLNFLGIDHRSCYEESVLAEILAPYLGRIEPFQFNKPTDAVLPSTHWSNADELLAYCQQVAAETPDGIFPSEGWLRKRGRHANRPGVANNTLAVYVRLWLGGVRNLRRMLGQDHASTVEWTEERAIEAYRHFQEKYRYSPGQVTGHAKSGGLEWPEAVVREAGRIAVAVQKFAGGAAVVQEELGIPISRRVWTAETVAAAYQKFVADHGISPQKAAGLWARQADGMLPEADSRLGLSIVNAYRRLIGNPPRENQRVEWTPEVAREAHAQFVAEHGETPTRVVSRAYSGKWPGHYPNDVVSKAMRVSQAYSKYGRNK